MNFIYPAIIATVFFIYYDATKNKIGKIPGENRFTNLSAGMWAFGAFMLWIIVFPLYLANRSKLIEKAKEHPQPVSEPGRAIKLCLLGALLLLSLTGSILDSSLFTSETTGGEMLSEMTGVWRGADGTMVTVDLASPNKSIKVNENTVPVTVRAVDEVNLIVTLNASIRGENEIWTLRQNYTNDKTFILAMTLPNGASGELSFVRNI